MTRRTAAGHARRQPVLQEATDLLKALGHPARLRIVSMLRSGSLCVCQMTAVLDVAVSTASAHLAELKDAGVLLESREGRFVSYRLADAFEAGGLLRTLVTLIEGDSQLEADARLVRSLRRVPVETLCRVDLDFGRLGLRRPAVDHE